MAPKRKDISTGQENTGREKKRQKLAIARTIAVQSIGDAISPPAGGPESSKPTMILNPLPSSIDVERFAEARAFEIDAMHTAMANASGSSTSRAWQALPRHLRRRAASHDVRRVPLRLRDKARAEMDPVAKKKRRVTKPGKSKLVKRTELFAKRQRDKLWLETHIWHAKRMKMENMWGYRLAVHPTEKAYRPSHRASVHGSILHDASYLSLIEIKGPENILKKILDACCDPHGAGPGSKRYSTGARALETYIYGSGTYPFGLLSPVTVIWKPLPSATKEPPSGSLSVQAGPSASTKTTSKRRGKRKVGIEEQRQPQVSLPDPEEIRVVWLRSHPSAFESVLSSIQRSASLVLEVAERETRGRTYEVEIADLRGQVNAFEIMGPKSNQVLRGTLSPVPQDGRGVFKAFWSNLANMQTSGELGRGTIVGFKVVDPRLKFPPKNAKTQLPQTDHITTPAILPSAQLAETEIWDEVVRSSLARPRYKKKDLDERRSKLLVPGTPLRPERQDDRIPVLLIQRSLEGLDNGASGIHGWTLIIPAGWSMAFFESLIFTGTRVGGQRERQTQAFEAQTAYFPRDLPSSAAYEAYSMIREREEKSRWERKPPAKRPNFAKLGTGSPWRADWEGVLGLPPKRQIPGQENGGEQEDMVATQREPEEVLGETEAAQHDPEIWLLRGSEASLVVSNTSKLFNHGAGLLREVNRLRSKRGHEDLDASVKAEALLKGALVLVKLSMCKRGAPEDLAMIYTMDDEEVRRWERALRRPNDVDIELPEEIALGSIIPPDASIIGYITTGHFSLSRGQGFGIGGVSLVKLLELQEQSERLHSNTSSPSPALLVKVRNRSSQRCRAARLEILAS